MIVTTEFNTLRSREFRTLAVQVIHLFNLRVVINNLPDLGK